jgi:hypothetical protein
MGTAALIAAASACILGIGEGTPNGSSAIQLPPADAGAVAQATTRLLVTQLPPAATTLYVVGTAGCSRGDTYTPALTASLRSAGFALASDARANPGARLVRYHVTEGWQGSVILRLQLDNRETTQLLSRDADGTLREAGQLTVREVQ